jgi:signal peptidase II
MKPRRLFWVLLALILIADQISKAVILKFCVLNQSHSVIPNFFDITFVRNDGIAFGFFQGKNGLFVLLACIILAFGIWWSRKLDWKKTEVNVIAAMILGGALGNLIDRVRIGYVVDFLDFHWKEIYHWPAFNIADSCISMSVVYIVLRAWFKPCGCGQKISDFQSSK